MLDFEKISESVKVTTNHMRLVIYTCIVDDYDWLGPIDKVWPDTRFICFTNTNNTARNWEIRMIDQGLLGYSASMINRKYKMFPQSYLPDHDVSIYIDGNIRLIGNPWELVSQFLDSGALIGTPSHLNGLKSITAEALQIKEMGKIPLSDFELLDTTVERYFKEGLPRETVVHECSVIFRRNDPCSNDKLLNCMNIWWKEFDSGVKRDQISFPYAVWKTNVGAMRFPFSVATQNGFFALTRHRQGDGWLDGFIHCLKGPLRSVSVVRAFVHFFSKSAVACSTIFSKKGRRP